MSVRAPFRVFTVRVQKEKSVADNSFFSEWIRKALIGRVRIHTLKNNDIILFSFDGTDPDQICVNRPLVQTESISLLASSNIDNKNSKKQF